MKGWAGAAFCGGGAPTTLFDPSVLMVYTYSTKTKKNAKDIANIVTPTTEDFTARLLTVRFTSPPSDRDPLPNDARL
jgi:hypothetical protein